MSFHGRDLLQWVVFCLKTLKQFTLLALVIGLPLVAQAGFTTPGQFSISPSGAATYSIPIQVPPGTAGMSPNLTLSYNSQGGNGILGMGWGLEGLSQITRCPQTMAQDGAIVGITYTASDKFCIDGQRLTAATGTYGSNLTEYRTEQANFAKIISYGTAGTGPAYFKVWTKGGQIIEYGNTTDSQILAQGKTTARLWGVNKITDTKGNYLTVTYIQTNATGESYVSRIDYTGNPNASPALTPYASVQFTYAAKTDIDTAYEVGSVITSGHRITDIKTYTGTTLIKDYKLTYEQGTATGKSRLKTLAECDGAGTSTCLQAMTMAWNEANVKFQPIVGGRLLASSYGTSWSAYLGDFNGDGKTDISVVSVGADGLWANVALGNGNGTFQPVVGGRLSTSSYGTDYHVFLGDFNGDGKTDISVVSVGASGLWANVALSNGNGTFQPIVGGRLLASSYGTSWSAYLGDFNGDGKTDISVVSVGADGLWANVALGNGNGTFQPVVGGQLSTSSYGTDYHVYLGDFNGDGKTDISAVSVGASGLWANVALGKGNGTFQPIVGGQLLASSYGTSWSAYLGDFNGDGKTDISVVSVGADGLWANVALGKGNGTFQPIVGGQLLASSYGTSWSAYLGDFNGDGKTDISVVSVGADGLWANVALGKGNGTFQPIVGGQLLASSYGTSWSAYLGDFNGDGKTDISVVSVGADGLWANVTELPLGIGDFLTSVTTGLGAVTNISYKPITDATVYTKDSGVNAAVYPTQDVQSPLYVVSSVTNSDGLGSVVTSNYTYGGAKVDLTGRGFLGFRWMKSSSPDSGLTQLTYTRQDFPYIGLPLQTQKSTISNPGVLLSVINNTYANTPVVTGTATSQFPYVSQTIETDNDLNGTALPSTTTAYQYDSYGNVTQVSVSSSDGYSKTTTNTYNNDTTNWFLGRLLRSSVQSTTP